MSPRPLGVKTLCIDLKFCTVVGTGYDAICFENSENLRFMVIFYFFFCTF